MILEHNETDGVVTLTWNDGENRFNADWGKAWHDTLEELEQREDNFALVVTGAGKFFSNGLDLDWMSSHTDDAVNMLAGVHSLFGRMLVFPAYTVAAINGHAFAGGAMLTCAFDHRIMREDRGFWCLPEVDLGLPLTTEMFAVVTANLPLRTAQEAMLTGRRYGGSEALGNGCVEATASAEELLSAAQSVAASVAGKNRAVIARHKAMLNSTAAAACGWPVPA